MAAKPPTPDAFMAALTHAAAPQMQRVRDLIRTALPALTERIKWNGPSFCHDGDDRITLGFDPKGRVRAILHRGVKVKDPTGFTFADPDTLAAWPAPDRAVITFASAEDLETKTPAFTAFCERWIEATA
jgi:hypothetical protein